MKIEVGQASRILRNCGLILTQASTVMLDLYLKQAGPVDEAWLQEELKAITSGLKEAWNILKARDIDPLAAVMLLPPPPRASAELTATLEEHPEELLRMRVEELVAKELVAKELVKANSGKDLEATVRRVLAEVLAEGAPKPEEIAPEPKPAPKSPPKPPKPPKPAPAPKAE